MKKTSSLITILLSLSFVLLLSSKSEFNTKNGISLIEKNSKLTDSLKETIYFTVDLNKKDFYQPVHTEICESGGLAIVAKFKGSKPFLGLGKYKSDSINFKIQYVFPEDRYFKIVNVKEIENKNDTLKLNVRLKKIDSNDNSEYPFNLNKGRNKLKKNSVIDYHLEIINSSGNIEEYKCGEAFVNIDEVKTIGDHICRTILTY